MLLVSSAISTLTGMAILLGVFLSDSPLDEASSRVLWAKTHGMLLVCAGGMAGVAGIGVRNRFKWGRRLGMAVGVASLGLLGADLFLMLSLPPMKIIGGARNLLVQVEFASLCLALLVFHASVAFFVFLLLPRQLTRIEFGIESARQVPEAHEPPIRPSSM
jgi:hypothetical protein